MERKLYEHVAIKLTAALNCIRTGNTIWEHKHMEAINELVRNHMPSGGGFDSGTTLDDASTPDKLIFNTSWHHMDDHGGYDGWTEHKVIVTASLALGFQLRITGRNRNSIKDYMHETFEYALNQHVDDAPAPIKPTVEDELLIRLL